jgi:hypothetical protein
VFTSAFCSEKPSVFVLLLLSKTKFHAHIKVEAKL